MKIFKKKTDLLPVLKNKLTIDDLAKSYAKLGFIEFEKQLSKHPYAVLSEQMNDEQRFGMTLEQAKNYANRLAISKDYKQVNEWVFIVNYSKAFKNTFDEGINTEFVEVKDFKKKTYPVLEESAYSIVTDPLEGILDRGADIVVESIDLTKDNKKRLLKSLFLFI